VREGWETVKQPVSVFAVTTTQTGKRVPLCKRWKLGVDKIAKKMGGQPKTLNENSANREDGGKSECSVAGEGALSQKSRKKSLSTQIDGTLIEIFWVRVFAQ